MMDDDFSTGRERAVDLLNQNKNRKVTVYMKGLMKAIGILHAFDLHLNVWLEDAVVYDNDRLLDGRRHMVIRGDNVLFIIGGDDYGKE